jgi:mRNA interferase RelE/StbE
VSYHIRLSGRAARELRDLSGDIVRRIDRAIIALSDEPRPPGGRKLRGRTPNAYRIRVGDYRVLYQIDDAQQVVTIYRIGHRREVYE